MPVGAIFKHIDNNVFTRTIDNIVPIKFDTSNALNRLPRSIPGTGSCQIDETIGHYKLNKCACCWKTGTILRYNFPFILTYL